MGHVLYMHQVLVEEARSTHDRRLNERQDRFDETRERVAQSFRQQLALLEPSIGKFTRRRRRCGPEWNAPAWSTWTPSNAMPRTTCVGEMLAGIREDRLSHSGAGPVSAREGADHQGGHASRAIARHRRDPVDPAPAGGDGPAGRSPLHPDRSGRAGPERRRRSRRSPISASGMGEGRAWSEPHQIEQRLHDLVNLMEGSAEANAFHAADAAPRRHARQRRRRAVPGPGDPGLPHQRRRRDGPPAPDASSRRARRTASTRSCWWTRTSRRRTASTCWSSSSTATTLAWDGRRFVWQDPDFRSAWIEFDKPPRAPLAKQILRGVQQATSEPVAPLSLTWSQATLRRPSEYPSASEAIRRAR